MRVFEEYVTTDRDRPRFLGVRVIGALPVGRKMGHADAVEETLVAPITLNRGHKAKTYNFSRQKPQKVRITLFELNERPV